MAEKNEGVKAGSYEQRAIGLTKLLPSKRCLFLSNEFGLLMRFSAVRPAGFEPATRGLEVRVSAFAVVCQRLRIGLYIVNSQVLCSPLFAEVRLGHCQISVKLVAR